MSDRIRIKDIAIEAGVSPGTVDRVLHNRGNVSPKSKEKVMMALKALDYSPNIIASALAYNKTWKIAALMPNEQTDPFWNQPKDGILRAMKVLKDYGVQVDFYHFSENNVKNFNSQSKSILEKDYHCVIISPIFNEESLTFLRGLEQKKTRYVQINTCLELDAPQLLCYIGQDSFHSGKLGAKLLAFGASSGETVLINHLEETVYNSQHLIDKENGFKSYFIDRPSLNIEVVTGQFANPYDEEGLAQFYADLFQKHPNTTGIFITTSRAFHVVKALKRLKREDIKLVGFDLIEENLKHLDNENIDFLINQNPFRQGYLALINIFNFLVRKIEPQRLQYLPLDVVMRENVSYYVDRQFEEMPIVL